MENKETAKRYMLVVLGLFFMGLGIAFVNHTGAGNAPAYALPGVLGSAFLVFDTGIWFLILSAALFVIEILIFRSRFSRIMFLQPVASVLLWVFIDAGRFLAGRFPMETYGYVLVCAVIGSVLIAFGVSLCVIANVILTPGLSIVKLLSEKTKLGFLGFKLIFDLACAGVALIVSIVVFDGEIIGLREGTVIAAVLTGLFANAFINSLKEEIESLVKR